MKKLVITLVAIFFVVVADSGYSQTGNVGRSTVGSGSMPASSGRSPALNKSREYTNGNLIVTGNVGGGRHFRGVVPYQSEWEFHGEQGSTSQNSFIRRSSESPYSRNYNFGQINQPYYLPSSTMSSLYRNSQSGLSAPRITSQSKMPVVPVETPKEQPVFTTPRHLETRPLATDTTRLETQFEDLSYLRQFQFSQLSLTEDDEEKDDREKLSLADKLDKRPTYKPEIGKYEDDLWKKSAVDKEFYDELIKIASPVEAEKADEKKIDTEADVLDELFRQDDAAELEKQIKPSDEKKPYEQEEIPFVDSKKVLEILGPHKTYEGYVEAKFSEHTTQARKLMQNGKYYKAANSYSLAGIFKRKDPIAVGGKAHALLAAGEYLSSSYYLSLMMTYSPEYAAEKIDLVKVIGDKDTLENNTVEIRQRYGKSESPELAFLLAYIYFHTDKLDLAEPVAAYAFEKMDDNAGVVALKAAIDAASTSNGKGQN